jgi:hypothetical protein
MRSARILEETILAEWFVMTGALVDLSKSEQAVGHDSPYVQTGGERKRARRTSATARHGRCGAIRVGRLSSDR